MSRPQLTAGGAYVPRLRITSEAFADVWGRHQAGGIASVSVADADEDVLTMAWEAATRALSAGGYAGHDVAFLAFATSTPPLDEEDLSVRLASTLGISQHARLHYLTGSTRTSTQALTIALDAGPWTDGVGLVVAADAPFGAPDETLGHAGGAGAGAFVLDAEGGASVVATGEGHMVGPGERFRRRGSTKTEGLGITSYDRDTYRLAIERAIDDLGRAVDEVDAVSVYAPDGKRPYRLTSTLGVDGEVIARGTTVHQHGDTGAASVPLGMVAALDAGVSSMVAIGYGSGAAADALLLDVTDVPIDADIERSTEIDYATYLRRRGHLTSDPPEGGGAYVSLPTWRRGLAQRHRLIAGACQACGELAFPPEGACPSCESQVGFDEVRLTGTGSIEAVTTISAGGAPPEFEQQQSRAGDFPIAIVAFDGPEGGQVSLPMQLVDGDGTPGVGDTVEAVIRLIYTQEGVPRYGVKARHRPDK